MRCDSDKAYNVQLPSTSSSSRSRRGFATVENVGSDGKLGDVKCVIPIQYAQVYHEVSSPEEARASIPSHGQRTHAVSGAGGGEYGSHAKLSKRPVRHDGGGCVGKALLNTGRRRRYLAMCQVRCADSGLGEAGRNAQRRTVRRRSSG